jgi:protein involved in polysaccharide export with SLBB domain
MKNSAPPDRASRRPAGAVMFIALLATLALPAAPAIAGAQEPVAGASGYVTRQELETLAAQADQNARSGDAAARENAAALRSRLREGDFKVGDKIVISTLTTVDLPAEVLRTLNDTLTVREGRTIRLPNMPDVKLDGVLRSELEGVLNRHVQAYIRNARIRAEILLPGVISGPVSRPGYKSFVPDMLVSDAIMSAGGLGGQADVSRTVVKRAGEEIIGRDSLQKAIRNGATLDRIDFQSGDELAVGEEKRRNWLRVLQYVSAIASLSWLVIRLTRN